MLGHRLHFVVIIGELNRSGFEELFFSSLPSTLYKTWSAGPETDEASKILGPLVRKMDVALVKNGRNLVCFG